MAQIAKIASPARPTLPLTSLMTIWSRPMAWRSEPAMRVIVPFGRGNRRSEGMVLGCGSPDCRIGH